MSTAAADSIRHALSDAIAVDIECLEVFPEIESTSSFLLAQPGPPAGKARVAMAEHQTSGRGRFGRRWISPPLSGLCMSMAYTFARKPSQLPGLTLAAGIAVIDALTGLTIEGVDLKWPNDLIARDRKLGGILTEARQNGADGTTVVIGIGVNIELSGASLNRITSTSERGAIDLASMVEKPPSIAALAVVVIEHLMETLHCFGTQGFAPFRDAWDRHDWLQSREISVETPEGVVSGRAAGIDDTGALVIRTKRGDRSIVSGSITLSRLAVAGE